MVVSLKDGGQGGSRVIHNFFLGGFTALRSVISWLLRGSSPHPRFRGFVTATVELAFELVRLALIKHRGGRGGRGRGVGRSHLPPAVLGGGKFQVSILCACVCTRGRVCRSTSAAGTGVTKCRERPRARQRWRGRE